MTAAVPTLATGAGVTIGPTTVTASVTYVAGSVYVVAFYAHHATVAFTDTTTVSGMSLTWTKLGTVRGGAVPNNEILTVFVGYGSGATGAITITPSQTPANGRYAVIEQTLAYGGGTVNPCTAHTYTNSGTGTTGTCPYTTLDQPGGRLMSFWGHRINEVVSPDTGWTEMSDAGATTAQLETQYNNGGWQDFAPGATWATSSSWLALALEMKAPANYAAVNPDPTGYYVGTRHRGYMTDEDEAVWAFV
jgi:hypothetical protein